MAPKEKHSIRIPGVILDSIKHKEQQGDYHDSHYSNSNGKKRKVVKTESRKERRQKERQLKKHKRLNKPRQVNSQPPKVRGGQGKSGNNKINLDETDEGEDPMEALKKLKQGKSTTTKDVKIVKEDNLDDDSFDDFDEFDEFDGSEPEDEEEDPMEALRKLKQGKSKSSGKDLKIVKEDNLDDDSFDESDDFEQEGEVGAELDQEFDSFDEELEYEEDPLAKLKALKDAKNSKEKKSSPAKPQTKPQDKSQGKNRKNDKHEKFEKPILPPQVLEQMKKDEDDMAFYAKKLGLGKKSNLAKTGEDDVIGGLLDGLDFDFGSEPEDFSEEESEVEQDDITNNEPELNNEKLENPWSDDSLSEGDFDTDISDLDDEEDDEEANTIPSKENPFVAPSTDNLTKYIPPALRRKMAMESGEVSAEVLALQKSIKGSFNKLSEANIATIVNDINILYTSNPRQIVNEAITNIVIESTILQDRLLDTFVTLHSCVITAIYRLQGVEMGANFIQTLVEKFDNYYQNNSNSSNTKQISNIISLLSAVYSFQLVSSKLIYDIIKLLITDFNESNAEILLRLIKNSGNQIRNDDPNALKEIIIMMNKVSSSMDTINPRTQFLIETINSLKNNKLRVNNDFSHDLVIRLRKFLGGLTSSKLNDTIQVSLDDIRNVETKGKWWLIGSAWKGNDDGNEGQDVTTNYDSKAMNDILDSAEPNWMQIAKDQRMNTDIRRAIFISIMSAEDYVDALTKLDKLALKKSQEREIPRILIHCTSVESSWNPYYGLLAHKLCDSHSYRKTFQFMFWDILKEFDGSLNDNDEDDDEFFGFDNNSESQDDKLKKIYNLGRFFGYLLSEGSLPLHSLKNVNFLVISKDNKLFLEIILVTFLDQIAKKSTINVVGAGLTKLKNSELKFHDKLLIERILKAKDEITLLRGLQYFIQEKTKNSSFVDSKRQKKRVEWGSNAMFDIIDELLLNSNDQ